MAIVENKSRGERIFNGVNIFILLLLTLIFFYPLWHCLMASFSDPGKLLANSDRWRDDSAFSRDAIDLAMLDLPPRKLRPAIDKAMEAYGDAVVVDMRRALDRLKTHPVHVQRCMQAMAMAMPMAVLQQRLLELRRRLERALAPSRSPAS